MDGTTLRNKRAQLRRGKATLFKKAHTLAKVHKIDIAVIMYENGRYSRLHGRLPLSHSHFLCDSSRDMTALCYGRTGSSYP